MNIKRLLKLLRLKHIYRNLNISNSVILSGNIVLGDNVTLNDRVIFSESVIGDFSYINYNSMVNVTTIGKFCSIGPNCVIGLGNHPTRKIVSTSPYLYTKSIFLNEASYEEHLPVMIGNDVWIGANATILNGAQIADGAIIAANSVVRGYVPPFTIYGGCPAHFIRKRFTDSEIDYLLALKWWNRDVTWIKQNAVLFENIKKMVEIVP